MAITVPSSPLGNIPPYLQDYIQSQAYRLTDRDGVWLAFDSSGNQSAEIDTAVQALVDGYDSLGAAKTQAKERIDAEKNRRWREVWPTVPEEIAVGLFDVVEDVISSVKTASKALTVNMEKATSIQSVGNTLLTQLNNATNWMNIVDYDVVNTPSWPV